MGRMSFERQINELVYQLLLGTEKIILVCQSEERAKEIQAAVKDRIEKMIASGRIEDFDFDSLSDMFLEVPVQSAVIVDANETE